MADDPKQQKKPIGDQVRAARKSLGLTQVELARRASLTRVAKRADDARQAFDEIDTNGNGSVTQAELRAAISGGLGR
ncbi:MAG: hypothetical protein AAF356_11725 [Planctomycetota bacterium]